MKKLAYVLMMILVLGFRPSVAGVVEDAEEELKKLDQDRKSVQTQTWSGSSLPAPPPSQGRTTSSNSTTSKSSQTSGSEAGSVGGGSSHGQGSFADEEEKGRPKRPSRPISEEDKKTYLFSFFALLLFGFLISIAASFARRVESEE